MAARIPPPRSRDDFDKAIYCALDFEASAVQKLFDDRYGTRYGKHPGDDNEYITGRIGQHYVVLCPLPQMNNINSAIVASSCKFSFPNVKLALVVGICGGVPQPNLYLGDVVISTGVVLYDNGRQESDGLKIRTNLEDTFGRPTKKVRSVVARLKELQSRHELQERTKQYTEDLCRKLCGFDEFFNISYPGTHNDRAYEATYRHKHQDPEQCETCARCQRDEDPVCRNAGKLSCSELECDEQRSRIRAAQPGAGDPSPQVHFGVVASSNAVMRSGVARDRVVEALDETKIIAFEMELAGVYDTAIHSVMIKGVCDYADSHKNKLWQPYAAVTAAACMKAFLEEWNPSIVSSNAGDRGSATSNNGNEPRTTPRRMRDDYSHTHNTGILFQGSPITHNGSGSTNIYK